MQKIDEPQCVPAPGPQTDILQTSLCVLLDEIKVQRHFHQDQCSEVSSALRGSDASFQWDSWSVLGWRFSHTKLRTQLALCWSDLQCLPHENTVVKATNEKNEWYLLQIWSILHWALTNSMAHLKTTQENIPVAFTSPNILILEQSPFTSSECSNGE